MLRMFLDLVGEVAFTNQSSLTPYTEEIDQEIDKLLKGVAID